MIAPDQAQKMLEAVQIEKESQRRLDALLNLPEPFAAPARLLFGEDQQAYDWLRRGRRFGEAAGLLDQLPVNDRLCFFETLFPGLSQYVEAAWQIQITRLPYQLNYQRRAFRAPQQPELSTTARGSWLTMLFTVLAPYRQDIPWIAAWAGYLRPYGGAAPELAPLFAAAIEQNSPVGDEVYRILLASARGEHQIGAMGRHVIRALLMAERPEGWEFVEKLLIAAQRQEGLRQAILESIDEAHPAAFPRMVRLILDHDLLRFSAAIRAVDVWFGMGWTVEHVRTVEAFLKRLARCLDDRGARAAALHEDQGDAEGVYMALWLTAFEDITAALTAARPILADPDPERRFAVIHLLGQAALPEVRLLAVPLLGDPDLRIVARAFMILLPDLYTHETLDPDENDLFERFEQLLPRLNTTQPLKPILWPWLTINIAREKVTDALISVLGHRSARHLIPYLGQMSIYGRGQVPELLANGDKSDPDIRHTLFALLADPSQWVRERALKTIADLTLTEPEVLQLESLLKRKAGDLRRAVLSMIIRRGEVQVFDSVDRLLAAKTPLERSGGLELLHMLSEADRAVDQVRLRTQAFQSTRARIFEDEEALVSAIMQSLQPESSVPSLDNALGLLDPAQQTPAIRPVPVPRDYITPAAIACVVSLDALIDQHSRTPVTYSHWGTDTHEALLATLPIYRLQPDHAKPVDQDVARLPLHAVWEQWWADRPAEQRDADGLELLRAVVLAPLQVDARKVEEASIRRIAEVVLNNGDWNGALKYPLIVQAILMRLIRLHPPAGAADFLLDAAETSYALIPEADLGRMLEPPPNQPYLGTALWWRRTPVVGVWLGSARGFRDICPPMWTGDHSRRLWRLSHWIDRPGVAASRQRPALVEVLEAYKAGGATAADLIDQLLGPRDDGYHNSYSAGFTELGHLTGRRPHPWFARYPGLEAIVARCRQRIVEVEANRGEMPTAASGPAKQLRAAFGIQTLFALLRNLGQHDFQRGWSFSDGFSKQYVLSHLIRVTLPTADDTFAAFTKQVAAARISQKRLLDLAVYAPHWARFVEHQLGWKGLEDAVWWIHAHTKDRHWSVDREVAELWTAEVSERTPLTAQDLLDGAVDVAWFGRVYKLLGAERWATLYASAKYAAGGQGSARATLFADAMLGKLDQQTVLERVTKKRHQDSIRAVGLLPLAKGAKKQANVLNRYESIQEFLRTGNNFGSQRRASEKLAAGIAMQNLARTAGYPDPTRLEWAMEARANADMRGGALAVTAADVTVTLTIDPWGEPALSVEKPGKRLKAIPPKVKKDPQIVRLLERKQDIKKQIARMRQSLEEAMCRGNTFAPGELRSLMAHPILAPMLEQLLFIDDANDTDDAGGGILGYPVNSVGGVAFQRCDGTTVPLRKQAAPRIAHPYDLYVSGAWSAWQRECFLAERIQPFKQVFRELYVLTDSEKAENDRSRRYAGHQVQPKQAAALLARRGWVIHPDEGARRTFHAENLSVWLSGLSGFFTPAEVEGETLEGVHFTRRGDWKPVPLSEVPPRVFSETMRDLDLVVSVAHMGGVDPEASASTVAMRAAPVAQTCELLKIDNTRVVSAHVLIDGKLGNYSVHLGSAVVHRQPGGAVCIVPVHSQHRGRIFLPFADDDPRTAEVVSKTILLARDDQIKDPTILEQLLIRR